MNHVMLHQTKKIHRLIVRLLAVIPFVLATATLSPIAHAQESILVNNGPFSTTDAWNNTNFSVANNFTLAVPAEISTIRFWAIDYSQSQNLSNFCGTMSWFIYDNSDLNRPENVVASGFSSAIAARDTGQTFSGDQIHIFELDIPTEGLSLESGDYWLRLKEGNPASSPDTSPILWNARNGKSDQGLRFDYDPIHPTAWASDGGTNNLAFQLFSPLDAGTAETPEPGTIYLFSMGLLPLTGIIIKRLRRINT